MRKKAPNKSSHVLLRTNKKALTGFEQVLVIILIVLTIFVVLMMIYKVDIIAKIKNLPGYSSSQEQQDETIIDSAIDSKLCPVRVGNVKGDYMTTQANINFCQDIDKQTNCRGDLYSGLKISGEEIQREVNWWPVDEKVGTFSNKIISLDSSILRVDSSVYKKIQGVYPFADLSRLLKNLNGAKLVGIDICRDTLITS